MNDSSRDGRLYWVVQQSLEEKPKVYRYRCCVGWWVFRLNTSCKSLLQVYVNGQKGMRYRQPKCRRDTDQTWGVQTTHWGERFEQRDKKLWRFGHRVPETPGDHCGSLDTDRCRRRKGAEEDRRVHLRTKASINQKKFEVECLWGVLRSVFMESDTLLVYADGGARDPSVLSCNKSSHIEARGV